MNTGYLLCKALDLLLIDYNARSMAQLFEDKLYHKVSVSYLHAPSENFARLPKSNSDQYKAYTIECTYLPFGLRTSTK